MTKLNLSVALLAAVAFSAPGFAATPAPTAKQIAVLQAKCAKLGAAAAKNAKCVALKKQDSEHADGGMMSHDDAMSPAKK